MIVRHLHFEILCALAPTGQLSPREADELLRHSRRCTLCAARLAELSHLGSELLRVEANRSPYSLPCKGLQERFVARAIRDGVPLHAAMSVSHQSPRPLTALRIVVAAMAMTILIAATLRSVSIWSVSRQTSSAESARVSEPRQANLLPPASPQRTTVSITPNSAMPRDHGKRMPGSSQLHPRMRTIQIASENTAAPLHQSPSHLFRPPLHPTWSATPDFWLPAASPTPQANPFLTAAYSRSAANTVLHFAAASIPATSILDDSDLSPLWTQTQPHNFEHPSFTYNARISANTQHDFLTALGPGTDLPSVKTDWNTNIARFHLLQNTTN